MNYFERARKFRAKKRLGQNFLIDEKAVETILDVSDITKDDVVILESKGKYTVYYDIEII